jgi:glutamate synthase (NADPH) small chain
MKKQPGFIKYERRNPKKRPVEERLQDYQEVERVFRKKELAEQAKRCMDCGIPFCHTHGCPVNNRIPEWVELASQGRMQKALDLLHATDNFPEITGRVCPAPCEASCTLSINQPAVAIRPIELKIIEAGFKEGWVVPEPAAIKSDKSVAIIGSGPAGLAAAQQLARAGHAVTVFEKADRIGGLLRYGIPDFKLNKKVLDRRLKQMKAEGVVFEPNADIGTDILPDYLLRRHDAVLLAIGATVPRELDVPGRKLQGIEQAMDFLTRQNQTVAAGGLLPEIGNIAKGKRVVVIGGGDTGADCVGTSNRQGAKRVTQIELLPKPPDERTIDNPWPNWPLVLTSSSSHDEGCKRRWSVATKRFEERNGRVAALQCVKLDWTKSAETGAWVPTEIPGSEFVVRAELVLLAMGFLRPEHGTIVENLGLKIDARGNLRTDKRMMTSIKGVFAAGDAVTGASLVVRAIHSGREAARHVDAFLKKS